MMTNVDTLIVSLVFTASILLGVEASASREQCFQGCTIAFKSLDPRAFTLSRRQNIYDTCKLQCINKAFNKNTGTNGVTTNTGSGSATKTTETRESCLANCKNHYESLKSITTESERQMIYRQCEASCQNLQPSISPLISNNNNSGATTFFQNKEQCLHECAFRAANLQNVEALFSLTVLTKCLETCNALPVSTPATTKATGVTPTTGKPSPAMELVQCENICKVDDQNLRAKMPQEKKFVEEVFFKCKKSCLHKVDGGDSCQKWAVALRAMYEKEQSQVFLNTLLTRATKACTDVI